ncbi:hypothetical protein TKK_0019662 [Trichogramma kaykai]
MMFSMTSRKSVRVFLVDEPGNTVESSSSCEKMARTKPQITRQSTGAKAPRKHRGKRSLADQWDGSALLGGVERPRNRAADPRMFNSSISYVKSTKISRPTCDSKALLS